MYIDKEHKTNVHTCHLLLFSSIKSENNYA